MLIISKTFHIGVVPALLQPGPTLLYLPDLMAAYS